MSSNCHTCLPNSQHPLLSKSRPHRWTILPESDHRQLQQLLRRCERDGFSGTELLAYVLRHKIMAIAPVRYFHDGDLVTVGCQVSYSVDGGSVETGLLFHRARSAMAGGAIPVSSLLGATLIGMRVGQRAPLLNEDGTIGSVAVLGLAQPG